MPVAQSPRGEVPASGNQNRLQQRTDLDAVFAGMSRSSFCGAREMNLIFIFINGNDASLRDASTHAYASPAPGLVAQKPLRARSLLGEYLAREARLRLASAEAFQSLSDALFAVGAPCALTGRAACAANDRRRHAELDHAPGVALRRQTGAAARRETAVAYAGGPHAANNVVEGCVRDTSGALVAAWQAEHARSRAIAAAMETIARDGMRHAALGWALSGWFLPQLKRREQTAVEGALQGAVGKLERTVAGGTRARA